MSRPRVAILASGSGSTTECFIKLTLDSKVNAEVVLVISSNVIAGVLDKVKKINNRKKTNIKAVHVGKTNFPISSSEEANHGEQTSAEEIEILKLLDENNIDLVLLFGYMKKVGNKIVKRYGWNRNQTSAFDASMLNTHPGLLPITKGLFGVKVQKRTLETNQPTAGHCIFAVDDQYDDGPIITEHKVEIKPYDNPEILFERVKESEKNFLGEDINYFLNRKYS